MSSLLTLIRIIVGAAFALMGYALARWLLSRLGGDTWLVGSRWAHLLSSLGELLVLAIVLAAVALGHALGIAIKEMFE